MHTDDEYADMHCVTEYVIGVQQQQFEDAMIQFLNQQACDWFVFTHVYIYEDKVNF
jgi:hypothetical protein